MFIHVFHHFFYFECTVALFLVLFYHYFLLFSIIFLYFFFAFNVRLIFRWPNLLLWLNQSENYRPVGDQGRASTGNSLNGGLQHRNLI